jgi:hypothetical protein
LKVFQHFDSALLALFRKADPASLKVWKLLDMEILPSWVKGKLALLGDAAHPFLPRELYHVNVFESFVTSEQTKDKELEWQLKMALLSQSFSQLGPWQKTFQNVSVFTSISATSERTKSKSSLDKQERILWTASPKSTVIPPKPFNFALLT